MAPSTTSAFKSSDQLPSGRSRRPTDPNVWNRNEAANAEETANEIHRPKHLNHPKHPRSKRAMHLQWPLVMGMTG